MRKDLEAQFDNLHDLIKNEDEISTKTRSKLIKAVNDLKKSIKIKRKVPKEGERPQSGFLKKGKVSTEMVEFANWDPEELYSRVDITKAICEYIKANNLQNPENRKEIVIDDSLKTLLRLHDDTVTYPRIQKYIGVHIL